MSPTTTERHTSWAVHGLRAYAAYMVLLSVLPGTDAADSRDAFSSAVGLFLWSMIVRRYARGGRWLTLFVLVTRGIAALVLLGSGHAPLDPSTYGTLVMTVLAGAVLVLLSSARRQLAIASASMFAIVIGYGCYDIVANQESRQARRVAYRSEVEALRKLTAEASASVVLRDEAATIELPKLPGDHATAAPGKLNLLTLAVDRDARWNGKSLTGPEQLQGALAGLLPPERIYLAIDARVPVDQVLPLLAILKGRPLRVLLDAGERPPLLAAPPALLAPFVSAYGGAPTAEVRTQLLHAELARLTVRCPDSLLVLAKPITSQAQLADDMLAGLERCGVGAVDLEQLRYVLLTPLHADVATPSELELQLDSTALPDAESVQELWQSLRAP